MQAEDINTFNHVLNFNSERFLWHFDCIFLDKNKISMIDNFYLFSLFRNCKHKLTHHNSMKPIDSLVKARMVVYRSRHPFSTSTRAHSRAWWREEGLRPRPPTFGLATLSATSIGVGALSQSVSPPPRPGIRKWFKRGRLFQVPGRRHLVGRLVEVGWCTTWLVQLFTTCLVQAEHVGGGREGRGGVAGRVHLHRRGPGRRHVNVSHRAIPWRRGQILWPGARKVQGIFKNIDQRIFLFRITAELKRGYFCLGSLPNSVNVNNWDLITLRHSISFRTSSRLELLRLLFSFK